MMFKDFTTIELVLAGGILQTSKYSAGMNSRNVTHTLLCNICPHAAKTLI